MKKGIIVVILLAAALLGVSTRQRTVGVDQVGVRTFMGNAKVYAAGETAWVLPVVQKFVLMTLRPVALKFSGAQAVVLDADAGRKVDCKIRYRIDDPAKFVLGLGATTPEEGLKRRLSRTVEGVFKEYAAKKDFDMGQIESRMLLTGESIHALGESAGPLGVRIISFELLNW